MLCIDSACVTSVHRRCRDFEHFPYVIGENALLDIFLYDFRPSRVTLYGPYFIFTFLLTIYKVYTSLYAPNS